MYQVDWEKTSYIATSFGFLLTVIGVGIVIVQTQLQRKQSRVASLAALYGELDTHESRLAREFIYKAEPESLTMEYLHHSTAMPERKQVEDTLAMLERMAYPIVQGQLPSDDAFNLYGGVLLSISYRLWPYVLDQRSLRKRGGSSHRLLYRRYLEAAIRLWAPRYANEAGLPQPDMNTSTEDILASLFRKSA